VEKSFAKWESGPGKASELPLPLDDKKMSLQLFSKAGLQQSQIRMGHLGIARTDPDYLRLRLANIVLGGAFASRLNQKVRDDLGLTYSISSFFESKKGTGSFEINTFARNEKVGEAISSTLQVVREFRAQGITQAELDAAKALLIGQFPAAIETADRLAFNLLLLRAYQVPDTYLSQFFSNIDSIQLNEVNAAIRQHLDPDRFKVVVFADEKSVQKELSSVGSFQVNIVR
jgi:zinc protease